MEEPTMKVRESGMPPQEMWQTFFTPERVLRAMGLSRKVLDAADLGCGYGTFAIPAASRILGTLHAFDIDGKMIEATRKAARRAGTRNIRLHLRDFISRRTGLPDDCVNYVMLFNILHAKEVSKNNCRISMACAILKAWPSI
jgi:predicted RNA methylase